MNISLTSQLSSSVPVPSVQFKGELKQTDPNNPGVEKLNICRTLHCDGLLLCMSMDETRLVVWNLLTGETSWITTRKGLRRRRTFVLGYCNNSKSYKILSCGYSTSDLQIYDLSSGSWRILVSDDVITPRWSLAFCYQVVSLKGSAYRLATDVAGTRASLSLLKFDFSTEKAVTTPLPGHWHKPVGLSVVREEKIAVLLQQEGKKTEVWVSSNKIGQELVSLSWRKILALESGPDLRFWHISTFLLDEEKKVLSLAAPKWVSGAGMLCDMMYIVGEDSKVTQVDLGLHPAGIGWESIHNYVPSLVRINQAGYKRKRGH